MRPKIDVPDAEQYECIACGHRATTSEARRCPACGGWLRNLSLSRDL